MADSAISQYLSKIINAVYGEDVRQAIYNSIKQCYSDVSNPTLNLEALQDIVQLKIDNGELANLTIANGVVTTEKLGSDVVETEKVSGMYYSKVLYDLTKQSGLERGSFINNVPTNAYDGTVYYTPYIKISDYESLTLIVEKGNPIVYYYDADKTFISSTYTSGILANKAPDGAEYIVLVQASSAYGDTYKLCYNSEYETKTLALESKGTSVYTLISGTMETDETGTASDLVPIVKGGEYTFTCSGNGYVDFYNSSGVKSGDARVTGSSVTFTVPANGETTHVIFGGWGNKKATLTGKFFVEKITKPNLKLVTDNFDSDMLVTLRQLLNIGAGTGGVLYNALDYGMTESAEDNTASLQAAMDAVAEAGGGIIWIPKGTYYFKSSRKMVNSGNMEGAVWAKSKVSILGESSSGTVLKMTGDSACGHGFALFAYYDNSTALEGCTYTNFTVDGADATISTYNHQGKAFYYHNIKDCVFRDLRLLNTPATALGIDMLVNTVMDSIYCENCGREWVYNTGNGGAGIGIGTGKFENENYIIRNCICIGCGHFGIFLEDQGIFSTTKDKNYPKGAIVTNNICRNGRYGGIGLRGGRYVLIQNNICYENNDAGIELDYGTKESDVLNNVCYSNGGAGIAIENLVDGTKADLNFSGNRMSGNAIGIKINSATDGLILTGNIIKGNTVGITTVSGQNDTAIKGNVIVDTYNVPSENFSGDTSVNELL